MPAPSVDDLAQQVGRTADHLRRLPESRLRRRVAPGDATVADEAHAVAQWLADSAATVDPAGRPPLGHPVSRLSDLAVGDQVAVTGQELVEALSGMAQADADPVAAEAARRLALLRTIG